MNLDKIAANRLELGRVRFYARRRRGDVFCVSTADNDDDGGGGRGRSIVLTVQRVVTFNGEQYKSAQCGNNDNRK